MLRWLSRAFMSPVQRSLERPDDYQTPVDPNQIKREINAGKMRIAGHDMKSSVLSTLNHYLREKQPMTIESVEADRISAHKWLGTGHTPCMNDMFVFGFQGPDTLLAYLIERANIAARSTTIGAPLTESAG